MHALTILLTVTLTADPAPLPGPGAGVTHSFLATGAETYIVAANGKIIWEYPRSTRDGWVLPNGNLLLALSKSRDYPGGAAVEVDRASQKILFEFKGTQAEVNTVQPLAEAGRILLTEAGPRPRLLEIDKATGRIAVEIPLQAQTENFHLQTRMARKLKNGNYLVPQLTDKVVREYDPTGWVVWEVKTPHWPFTAIRLDNGNTLIHCTVGNTVIEVNPARQIVWQLVNEDLPAKLINDACGGQRLPNGNTVICSYRLGPAGLKLFEVTPDKKVVWTYFGEKARGIHEVHILDTDGQPITNPMR